jgi:hypothetical protein
MADKTRSAEARTATLIRRQARTRKYVSVELDFDAILKELAR